MYKFIFQNRRAALLFVALMALSATQLVGTQSEAGALKKVEEQLLHQRADIADTFEQPAAEIIEPEPQVVEEWAEDEDPASDDELIDTAEGYDPSPDEDYAEPMFEE